MTDENDPLERIAVTLETFDTRLSSIDARFANLESSLEDDAHATEESAKSLQKLEELYLSMDQRLEHLTAMIGEYVNETRQLRRASQQLVSEVREKLASNG
jgi:chromosome segregation ATPase